MNLLIDIGNTRFKWSYWQNSQLSESRALPNTQVSEQQLIDAWQHLPTPLFVGLASVSKPHLQKLLQTAISQLWPSVHIQKVQAQATAFGVVNAYEIPEKLGVDRWLGLIAAKHLYPGSVCVVDCGTAITIDIMDADGIHLGGLISPGLATMKNSLVQNTELLEFNSEHFHIGLANKTNAAIYCGTLFSAIGLIEFVIAKYSECQLLLTGGDCYLIASQLTRPHQVDESLVLHGLSIVLQG